MAEERLQKLIAKSGFCSRRKAEELIKEGRVSIDNQIGKLGDKADSSKSSLLIDGIPLPKKPSYKVYLLNKPAGVICSNKDPQRRLEVINLLPNNLRDGMHPVGRLDLASRGAILLSNHGELTMRLTHPRYSHKKTYNVLLEGIICQNSIREWREGVELNGKITRAASVELKEIKHGNSLLKIILQEGRNRQIRRIAEMFGHNVIDLQRIAIGNIKLNSLREGDWREVKKSEWEKLIRIN